ncbi:MAG: anaerobic sulfatase maturase [Eubacteriales bacterium]|nr:anaerobic sulfatase maturase [Eubacteriales bacterium]
MPAISMMIKPVSGACNMRCTYCFYADEAKNRTVGCYGSMTEETLEAIVRKAFAFGDQQVGFTFQGGEPTLAGPAFYQNLLRLERKYNSRGLTVQHALQTNGYCLSDELLAVLKEGGFLLGVSIDGNEAIHDSRRLDQNGNGTYRQVLRTIDRLKAAKIDYNILCVVDNAVADNADACYQALREHRYLQFIPCIEPFGQERTVLDPRKYGEFLIAVFHRYADDYENGHYTSVRTFDNWLQVLLGGQPEECSLRGRCSSNFLLESNGDVFPCDFYALDQWKMGNINQLNFSRLAKTETVRRFVELSLAVDERCRTCPWFRLCRGGCRRDREPLVSGEPLVLNRLCESHRMFFEACADRLKRLASLPLPKSPVQFT